MLLQCITFGYNALHFASIRCNILPYILSTESQLLHCNSAIHYIALLYANVDAKGTEGLKDVTTHLQSAYIYIKIYWPAGGGRGQNPEKYSVQNALHP